MSEQKYAVIQTGGKQYRVSEGDRITVERLAADEGSDITIDRVLLIGGNGETKIGTPVVDGATVTASVDEHNRGKKIEVFKFKAKKRYRRHTGHRDERRDHRRDEHAGDAAHAEHAEESGEHVALGRGRSL